MDSHKRHRYGFKLTGADHISYRFPSANPLCSASTAVSLKPDLGNSPISPLSSQFDCESSLPSLTQEQHSSTDTETRANIAEGYAVCSQISMRHVLQEIESVLMAPDSNEAASSSRGRKQKNRRKEPESAYHQHQHPENRHGEATGEAFPCVDIKHLLTECAEALDEGRIADFESLVKETREHVSINGDPIQRVGAYMLEGLVARHESSGTNIYRALRCRQPPESKELLSYMRILYDICPYFKFGYMAANGAIAEAIRSEDRIHIIDFQIAQGTQWVTLIQALAARPGGPPLVRITGIDDPDSKYARGTGLQLVGGMLSEMSKKFCIPLEFKGLSVYGPQVTREMLEIKPGEALAVNFTLQLHHTPDESVDVNNPRDGLLRMVKGLSPKVVTVVEQESNTNTAPFLTRFAETFDYYSAMFESIDVTLHRKSRERVGVEQHCLAKDIVNVIACEGKERIERHELLGKWRSRLTMAGFRPFPLSSYVNSVIKTLLGYYSNKYTLVEKDGAMLLGWSNRNLISASAWH
ncbi:Chitin-inducible gibberellin-responsive protein 1 [Apostasia shenzhenica]|uniref:Chitin-inducible gibberellin-responsive protein 1 n=1 Tax=Apostasia shenzhenica TaxID=1088818 RepID=A0A2H9ZSW4_9ASPA|nr:Chitin-inducible gibberellin-responsive protein 1 [Apostasia shenzhenica]